MKPSRTSWLLSVFLVVAAAIFLFRVLPERKPQLTCAFFQRPDYPPLTAPSGKAIARRFWVKGSLERSSQEGMLHFKGEIAADALRAKATGTVWLNARGIVEGMFASGEHPDFSGANLSIATLGESGYLDPDPNTVYIQFDKSEKFRHPTDYACRVTDFR